jgi:hypothetical protein
VSQAARPPPKERDKPGEPVTERRDPAWEQASQAFGSPDGKVAVVHLCQFFVIYIQQISEES